MRDCENIGFGEDIEKVASLSVWKEYGLMEIRLFRENTNRLLRKKKKKLTERNGKKRRNYSYFFLFLKHFLVYRCF